MPTSSLPHLSFVAVPVSAWRTRDPAIQADVGYE
jgi:hypothetical protein